ncbi:nucleotidyl transferase AbiEii/AbiGii toxin family protein [Corynebacterium urealyticum]|uniref:nucleotidyl transferase AbiEii/AbiGii toxin family protein n=1 Tax=Corynebacterium urealyticum TaxID=43771 RepID=UPI0021CC573C|nr:nucleotidyl transferase AbiEii/AbiGii toxin family protein [Corynebacterium urealyticum]
MNQPLTTREARNLQKSLNMRISNEAKSQGRSRDSIRFQLVFESMLRLIFRHPSPGWTLKGGTALLMRNGKGRFTRDMDLARSKRWDSSEELINDLKKLVQGKNGDPFTFEVKEIHSRDNTARGEYATPTATVSIEARLGTLQFHTFKIDVSLSRHTQAPPEHVEVNPLLNT